jgi:hypothetical protein
MAPTTTALESRSYPALRLSIVSQRNVPVLAVVLLGYGLTCASDAQVVTGFELVPRTLLKRAMPPVVAYCLV